jgi:hypothetical protein
MKVKSILDPRYKTQKAREVESSPRQVTLVR